MAMVLLKKKKESQCCALTWNIFWFRYIGETEQLREEMRMMGMERMFSYEKRLKRLGLFRGEINKWKTVKLAKVMITVKKSRMGICILFLKLEQKNKGTLIETGWGKLKTDERKYFIHTLHN